MNLMMVRTGLALAVLERALNPVTLALHLRQSLHCSLRRGIAQAIFDLIARLHFPAHNQVPFSGLNLFPVSQPNPLVQGKRRISGNLQTTHVELRWRSLWWSKRQSVPSARHRRSTPPGAGLARHPSP
jgi:hypothetical protein